MKHLSIDPEDHPSRYENSYKLFDEKGHLLFNLKEIQWKLRQQHDQKYNPL